MGLGVDKAGGVCYLMFEYIKAVPMNLQHIQSKINKIQEETAIKYQGLAKDYSESVLIPFCKKYSLDFNSDYYWGINFSHKNKGYLTQYCIISPNYNELKFLEAMPEEFVKELKNIFDVLNIEISYNVTFSVYIDNVYFKDQS